MRPNLLKIFISKDQKWEDGLKWYETNQTVREEEKDKNGEVFTPHKLVVEMLDQFPDSVWKNKNLKWLDPAAGYGQFMFEVVNRLMDGLKDEIKDEKRRLKHILKKQIYQVEFNSDSVAVLRGIFGNDANIINCSFVEGDYVKVLGKNCNFIDKTMNFDCIIGNPPFNNTKKDDVKGGEYNNLWYYFVQRSLSMNKRDGMIGFIHNGDWRGYKTTKFSLIDDLIDKKYDVKYLHMLNVKQVQELFNVSLEVDLYVWKQNDKQDIIGQMIDRNGKCVKISLRDKPFSMYIPSVYNSVLKKVLQNNVDQNMNIIWDTSTYHGQKLNKGCSQQGYCLRDKKTLESAYPVVHTIRRDGLNLNYTNKRNPQHYLPKVIFYTQGDGFKRPFIDSKGEYGLGQLVMGMSLKGYSIGKLRRVFGTQAYKQMVDGFKVGRDYKKDYFNLLKKDWVDIILQNDKKRRRSRSRRVSSGVRRMYSKSRRSKKT